MTTRRHFFPEQKATIGRRHLTGKDPVSNLAGELGGPTEPDPFVDKAVTGSGRTCLPVQRPQPNSAYPEQLRLAALEAAVNGKDALLGELLPQFARQLVATPSHSP